MKEVKYYSLMPARDLNEVGVRPQIQKTTSGVVSRTELDNFSEMSNQDIIPDNISVLTKLSLSADANLTDILSVSYLPNDLGILYNKRVKSIFDNYSLGNIKYFPGKVYHKDDIFDYFFLYINRNQEIIDFSNSKFFVSNSLGTKLFDRIVVDSLEDLRAKFKAAGIGKKVIPAEVAINKKLDIFKILFDPTIYVSQELKLQLEKEKITGVTFDEVKLKLYLKV